MYSSYSNNSYYRYQQEMAQLLQQQQHVYQEQMSKQAAQYAHQMKAQQQQMTEEMLQQELRRPRTFEATMSNSKTKEESKAVPPPQDAEATDKGAVCPRCHAVTGQKGANQYGSWMKCKSAVCRHKWDYKPKNKDAQKPAAYHLEAPGEKQKTQGAARQWERVCQMLMLESAAQSQLQMWQDRSRAAAQACLVNSGYVVCSVLENAVFFFDLPRLSCISVVWSDPDQPKSSQEEEANSPHHPFPPLLPP